MDTLQEKLTDLDTDPEILDCIISSLKTWHADQDHTEITTAQNPLLVQALTEQHFIGWFPFVEGLISTAWQAAQAAQALHYSSIDTRRTSHQWSRRLIQLLHNSTDNLWHHRNEIKHVTDQPRQTRMHRELSQEIAKEFMIGPTGLLQGDSARFFQRDLITLLKQNPKYKHAWLYQLTQARQRHKRKLHHDDELKTISQHQSKLFKWFKTGVAS